MMRLNPALLQGAEVIGPITCNGEIRGLVIRTQDGQLYHTLPKPECKHKWWIEGKKQTCQHCHTTKDVPQPRRAAGRLTTWSELNDLYEVG
ncbi:MAG: hypothetical protein C4551_10220 [Bacillota bacterium]|nr:MAG: hypothetical protein C4551_10220 [Bacillota bacterium]